MGNKRLARCFNGQAPRIRPIGANLQLPFHADPKNIGSFLVGKMLALSITTIVVVIDKPSGFGFASEALSKYVCGLRPSLAFLLRPNAALVEYLLHHFLELRFPV